MTAQSPSPGPAAASPGFPAVGAPAGSFPAKPLAASSPAGPIASILVLFLLLLTACAKTGGREEEKPVVAVSFPGQAWLLDRLAPGELNILTLLPPGADAEHFEPSLRDLRRLDKASIWLTLETEGFEQALRPSITARTAPRSVRPDSSAAPQSGATHHGIHAHGDPHLLSSLRNARQIAAAQARAILPLLPGREAAIRANLSSLDSTLVALDDSIQALLTPTAPAANRAFIIFHPSLSYFAGDYGLRQLAIEADGKEATPASLARILRDAKDQGIRVYFAEAEHPNPTAEALAREAGLTVIPISLSAPDYLSTFRTIANALR